MCAIWFKDEDSNYGMGEKFSKDARFKFCKLWQRDLYLISKKGKTVPSIIDSELLKGASLAHSVKINEVYIYISTGTTKYSDKKLFSTLWDQLLKHTAQKFQ